MVNYSNDATIKEKEFNMASSNNKKLSILYVLKVLQEFSDINHPLTQSEIAKKIYSQYGMECERKSIAYNIESLIDIGYDIVKAPTKGVYLGMREFEPSEITYLIDAVFSSKTLTSKQSQDLSNKLSSFLSSYDKKKYKYVYKSDEINRTNNKQLFYNIDIINEAIENNKQIKFTYNAYDINGNLKPKRDGKEYIVNPYFMINSCGKYYLVCNYDYYDEIANYKIELITNISLLDCPIKPVTELQGFKNGIDISKYINEHIYMFTSPTVTAKLKVYSESSLTQIFECFGKNARAYKDGDGLYAMVTAEEDSLIYWCVQFGDIVELIEPQSTRNEIKKIINKLKDKYGES